MVSIQTHVQAIYNYMKIKHSQQEFSTTKTEQIPLYYSTTTFTALLPTITM